MIALSLRQPWAWLVMHAGKDIENRSWATKFRGRILVHASRGMTREEWEDGFCTANCVGIDLMFPVFEALPRGGVVGSVEIVDCVASSDSPWFGGPFGFVLRDPQPRPFVPYKGRLGFFDIPDHVLLVTP